ncbi:MAG: amino acid adenylation domain-containing protein, partial [Bacteroidetes bacterium]
MAQRFIQLCQQVCEIPQKRVHQLDILSEDERKLVYHQFVQGIQKQLPEQTIVDLFQQQVKLRANDPALNFKGRSYSYLELDHLTNQLANYLIQHKNWAPEQPIAIQLERNEWMIISLIAVFKTSCPYLPIDPETPGDRIEFMLQDSGASIRIDHKLIQEFQLQQENISTELATKLPEQKDLAYIIYTSGSTGKPKGVQIQHRALLNLGIWHQDYYKVQPESQASIYANFSFDAFIWETVPYLISGATLHLIPVEERLDPTLLQAFISERQISHCFLPTPVAEELFQQSEDFPLETVFLVGGDRLKQIPSINNKVYNNYGPTENTVVSTACLVPHNSHQIPIGRPILNQQIYILDDYLQAAPIGIPGELYLGGEGLSCGYLNLDDLTDSHFISSPFTPSQKLYRTGDLGYWDQSGNIIFAGRKDYQVKIRGYRIEIGEIESRLLEHEAIESIHVLAIQEEQNYLCAYYTSTTELAPEELKAHLLKWLPGYMVPKFLIRIEALPLTANGKVDASLLPKPSGEIEEQYIEPNTETERKLSVIWEDLLGLKKISTIIDFFELGGHSLKVMQLASRIHQDFQRQISIYELFQVTTIQGQAKLIDSGESVSSNSIPVASKNSFYPLSAAQKRMFLLQQFGTESTNYNIPLSIQVTGKVDLEQFQKAFQALIDRHEVLRSSFHWIEGEAYQRVEKNLTFNLEFDHCLKEEQQQKALDFVKAFQLEKAPLLRVKLYQVTEEESLLLLDIHHIISDGLSLSILMEEFILLYDGWDLDPVRIHYKDFASWQQDQMQEEVFQKSRRFWLEQFENAPPALDLPFVQNRPPQQMFSGANMRDKIDSETFILLNKLNERLGSTLFMSFMGALKMLFYKYTNQEDLVIGSPTSGRNHPDLKSVPGMFVNTLAIRTILDPESSILEFLKQVQSDMIEVYQHQDYPFDELVEALEVPRDLGRNPLFDVMLHVQNGEQETMELGALEFDFLNYDSQTAKFDLTLNIIPGPEHAEIRLNYATHLFSEQDASRIIRDFKQVLKIIVQRPETKLRDIELISPSEREFLLQEYNRTESNYPKESGLAVLFEQQVLAHPDKLALRFGAAEFTYAELNQRANQLANYLEQLRDESDRPVAILLRRSPELYVAILAVLKLGAPYLPL